MKYSAFFATLVVLALLITPCAHSAQLNFTPAFIVTEEYNDNIFLTPDDEDDDFITRVSLGGTLELLGRTSGAELTYFPAYEWYDDFSDNDGWTHDALGRTYYNFAANTSIELRDAFKFTRDNAASDIEGAVSDDPLLPPDIQPDRLRRNRDEYYINVATATLDHRFGSEDTVYSSFSYRIFRGQDYGDRPDDIDDYDIWEPSIGGAYWFSNLWGAEADLLYSHRDYEEDTDREEWTGRFRLNRRLTRHLDIYAQYEHTTLDYDSSPDPNDVDYDLYKPTVGFNYQLDQNTRIEIGGGWYFQDRDRGGNEDGFVLESLADKIWPFRQGLIGVTLLSGTDIDDEGSEDLGFNVYYEGRLRGEYAFTPRFSCNATAGYRWDDYPDEEPDERTDKTMFGTVGLEYQALRWMFLNLDYTFRDLDSDEDRDEYTENRVLFSITLTPDRPYRLMQ